MVCKVLSYYLSIATWQIIPQIYSLNNNNHLLPHMVSASQGIEGLGCMGPNLESLMSVVKVWAELTWLPSYSRPLGSAPPRGPLLGTVNVLTMWQLTFPRQWATVSKADPRCLIGSHTSLFLQHSVGYIDPCFRHGKEQHLSVVFGDGC